MRCIWSKGLAWTDLRQALLVAREFDESTDFFRRKALENIPEELDVRIGFGQTDLVDGVHLERRDNKPVIIISNAANRHEHKI